MNTAFVKAYETLSAVYNDGAFSTLTLNRQLAFCKQRDKALVTKIVYGVLENDILLQYIISKYARKMPKGDTLIFLKIGVYCLKELSIPSYAVVNDVAELAKISEDRRIVGFVNATLKNIAKTIDDFDEYPTDFEEMLSVKYSYPLWAVKKLVKDYGSDVATKIVSAKSDNRTVVRFANGANARQIADRNGATLQSTVFDDAFFVSGNLGEPTSEFTPQGLASMAIARICASFLPKKFLDCCSAPGGKAVYFKQLCPQSDVVACDIHPHRVKLIESYASRMGVELTTKCLDMAERFDDFADGFDLVLCDAPCSGFGVVDSRPDIKIFRENKDISDLMKLQYSILDNCSAYVKKGGALVYSTCTVFDNENGQTIRKFLKNHPDFSFGKIVLPQFPDANGQESYQFLPYKDGTQGFFVAVLKRN